MYLDLRRELLNRDADTRFRPDLLGNVDQNGKRRFLESGLQEIEQMSMADRLKQSSNIFDRMRIKSDFNSGRFATAGSLYGFANGLPTFKAMLDELKSIRTELRITRASFT